MAEVANGSEEEAAVDIYEEHIIPLIDKCTEDDQLLFATPSAFFGFHSVGAKTYENVCDSLVNAREKGVTCRVLIDVGDLLSAAATQGLLSFLNAGTELRDLREDPSSYFLLRYCGDESEMVEFNSKSQRPMRYMYDVRVRKFGNVKSKEKLSRQIADDRLRRFDYLWDNADQRVKASIDRYMPYSYLKRRFDFVQLAALIGFFGFGSLFGFTVTLSYYQEFDFSLWVRIASVLGGLFLGVIASSVAAIITRNVFRAA